jgi:TMEM199 family protein
MVLLTMTASIVEALVKLGQPEENAEGEKEPDANGTDEGQEEDEKSTETSQKPSATALKQLTEPSLSNAKVGNPISHGQVVDISRDLKIRRIQPNSLEALLKGSRVYAPAPLPRAEPVSSVIHPVFGI